MPTNLAKDIYTDKICLIPYSFYFAKWGTPQYCQICLTLNLKFSITCTTIMIEYLCDYNVTAVFTQFAFCRESMTFLCYIRTVSPFPPSREEMVKQVLLIVTQHDIHYVMLHCVSSCCCWCNRRLHNNNENNFLPNTINWICNCCVQMTCVWAMQLKMHAHTH